MLEQKTVKTRDTQKNVWEYTTEELRSVLGDFEKEYHKATTGEAVHNNILGHIRKGNIEHALRIGAITKRENHYFVKLPEYINYDLKIKALGELLSKRSYAQKMNDPLKETRDKIFN